MSVVDHPADQAWKRARVAAPGIEAAAGPRGAMASRHGNANGAPCPEKSYSFFW
jgi:hypothetical protein